MIPVEQSIFLFGSPWSAVIHKFLSFCQSAKITMASPSGSVFALRVEASDLAVAREMFLPQDKWLRAPFGRLALFRTRHVLHTLSRR